MLGLLEKHFEQHDYILGGKPSLGDYGLLAPLYAHLYRDAVAGFALRTFFPVTTEWVERTNGEGALNARRYGQKLYSLDAHGDLVPRDAVSDQAEWLREDRIPETLLPVIGVFFEEMWPVLRSSTEQLRHFIQSESHEIGGELPGKTFTATPGFEAHQTGQGALTHAFEIGGVHSRRMVVPYQIWMLQRLEKAIASARAAPAGEQALKNFLAQWSDGSELLALGQFLQGCRVRKEGARLFSQED